MPDEYDAIRRGLSNYERGLYFELGRAYIRGETADRGWVRQFKIETGKGSRIIDSARTEGLGIRAVERKSGRLNEREAREQLIRERAGIDSGKIARSDWETVAGEKIPRSVSNDMHALSEIFQVNSTTKSSREPMPCALYRSAGLWRRNSSSWSGSMNWTEPIVHANACRTSGKSSGSANGHENSNDNANEMSAAGARRSVCPEFERPPNDCVNAVSGSNAHASDFY